MSKFMISMFMVSTLALLIFIYAFVLEMGLWIGTPLGESIYKFYFDYQCQKYNANWITWLGIHGYIESLLEEPIKHGAVYYCNSGKFARLDEEMKIKALELKEITIHEGERGD